MTPAERTRMLEDLAIADERAYRRTCKFKRYFPDEGPLRRALYPRSLLFFMAGSIHRERMFLAANRTSKTVSAAYEVTAHLTGDYPHWWVGRKFDVPIDSWAAGDTRETTRDIVQNELVGSRDELNAGTYASGMLPRYRILDRSLKTGVSDCVDTVWVRWGEELQHGAPVVSTLAFKSYDQGRKTFQGTSKHLIWLDEEPPESSETASSDGGAPSGNGDIYTECLLRTATTDGLVIETFTPLRGLTVHLAEYLKTAVMCDAAGVVVSANLGLFGEAA